MTTADPTPDHQPNQKFRLVLLVVLLVVLVASAGTLGWLLVDRDSGSSDAAQADREAVMSQAEQFVLRLNTYGPDQLDDEGRLTEYRDQVKEVITPKFASEFETSGLPIAEETVKTAGYGRSVEIFGVGVESIDEDSATVIIAAGMTGSYPDPKNPDDPSRRVDADEDVLRWEIPVVKVDGEWLVDDYTPVTGEDAP